MRDYKFRENHIPLQGRKRRRGRGILLKLVVGVLLIAAGVYAYRWLSSTSLTFELGREDSRVIPLPLPPEPDGSGGPVPGREPPQSQLDPIIPIVPPLASLAESSAESSPVTIAPVSPQVPAVSEVPAATPDLATAPVSTPPSTPSGDADAPAVETAVTATPPALAAVQASAEVQPPAAPPPPVVTRTSDGWIERRVESGDTLANLVRRLGLSPTDLANVLRVHPAAADLERLQLGDTLRLRLEGETKLVEVALTTVAPRRASPAPTGESRSRPATSKPAASKPAAPVKTAATGKPATPAAAPARDGTHLERRTAVIQKTLYGATRKAGVPDPIASSVTQIFKGHIDFQRDLRPGDRLTLVYEERWKKGKRQGTGPLLAVELASGRTVLQAVRYTDSGGKTDYYRPDGSPLKQAFFRTPVDSRRITSGFTKSRLHPVLNVWRAHEGIDYAAPQGAPVYAAADGVVRTREFQSGYGNVVFLQHGRRYTTVYAHLSGFAKGLKTGGRVTQGQVIGYVGQTGLATGPHLHYEIRVDGAPRNPLAIAGVSIQDPMNQTERRRFDRAVAPAVAQLTGSGRPVVAARETRK